MIAEDAYVDFLIEHNLTQSQYLLLHLVYKGRHDLIKRYKDKFPSGDTTMIGEYMTDDLFKRDFLSRTSSGKVVIGKVFLGIFLNKHTATDEIFDIYPTHFVKDGTHIPLSAMDRNVFANLYDKAILSSMLEHLEVVKDIKFGLEQGLLNIGLDKFLKSKYWLTLRPKRLDYKQEHNTKTALDNEF